MSFLKFTNTGNLHRAVDNFRTLLDSVTLEPDDKRQSVLNEALDVLNNAQQLLQSGDEYAATNRYWFGMGIAFGAALLSEAQIGETMKAAMR